MKSLGSTDAESSAASSGQETLAPLGAASSQTLQRRRTELCGSSVQLQNPVGPDLEAQIREIAAREGVILASTNPQPLTSIAIATRRRSAAASPSTSPASPLSPAPEPLHLAELSTGAVEPPEVNGVLLLSTDEEDEAAGEPLFEPSRSPTPLSAPGNQTRRDAVGGQLEAPPPPSLGLGSEDVTAEDHNTQSFRRHDELSVQSSSVPGVGHEAEQATCSSTSGPAAGTTRVSLVHLTPSPTATDHTPATAVHSGLAELPRGGSVPLRHSSSAASSPDEGVGLSSPPEWHDTREPVRRPAPERAETSPGFNPAVPQGRPASTATRCFTPRHRGVAPPRPPTAGTPALPVLLPYKPRGSEELFYVPQTEADVSSTSMESSHTGSDDAVPPCFSSEVLGHRDAGSDRGVTIRHSEGVYSKRLKTAAGRMQEPGRRGAAGSEAPTPSSQGSLVFSRLPLSSNQEASKRNQGTSPVHFPSSDPPAPSRVRFQPLHVDYDKAGLHLDQSSAPEAGGERDQERRDPHLPRPAARQSSSTLDQLWERFCEQWSLEESRPTSDREASLLERLEGLTRLIHSTRETRMSALREEKRSGGCEARAMQSTGRGGREVHGEPPGPLQAWTQRLQGEEASGPAHEDIRDSFTSRSQHLCPADRDESETSSTVSGSVSTVDTARLVRAFGAHRVQRLIPSSSLSKLYSSISKQKEGREQRSGRLLALAEGADGSTAAADSTTSTSTDSRAPRRGAARTPADRKSVRVVSRGVQAGDLELVSNGTRRRTRDVGTTFPSPGEARTSSSSSSLERGRGGKRSLPEAVSWFISAEDLRSEARKENRPEEQSTWRPSTACFQLHSRTNPWREPLSPRQVQQDRHQHAEPALDPRPKARSSGLARISLREALELRRPQFISRSRWRVKRLALQVEERKLREEFSRERDALFSRPGGPGRLQRPAGAALLRRAVPRREMLQRSKQIYESLPEVQRRREEERRIAEYRSYRLNAQLYNKRITERVLSRRAAWH
ncbi:centrosome-associated protein ALMS1-like [Lycodopsis pacificus]